MKSQVVNNFFFETTGFCFKSSHRGTNNVTDDDNFVWLICGQTWWMPSSRMPKYFKNQGWLPLSRIAKCQPNRISGLIWGDESRVSSEWLIIARISYIIHEEDRYYAYTLCINAYYTTTCRRNNTIIAPNSFWLPHVFLSIALPTTTTTTTTTMTDESSASAPETATADTSAPTKAPAPSSTTPASTWALPVGIEDDIEQGTSFEFESICRIQVRRNTYSLDKWGGKTRRNTAVP